MKRVLNEGHFDRAINCFEDAAAATVGVSTRYFDFMTRYADAPPCWRDVATGKPFWIRADVEQWDKTLPLGGRHRGRHNGGAAAHRTNGNGNGAKVPFQTTDATKASRAPRKFTTWPGLVSPEGQIYWPGENLAQFCRLHRFDYWTIYSVLTEKPSKKALREGWRITARHETTAEHAAVEDVIPEASPVVASAPIITVVTESITAPRSISCSGWTDKQKATAITWLKDLGYSQSERQEKFVQWSKDGTSFGDIQKLFVDRLL